VIKPGQLRRWRDGYGWFSGKTFLIVERKTAEITSKKYWSFLIDGKLEHEYHFEIERGSEVIE
jgi:hypothetical protein